MAAPFRAQIIQAIEARLATITAGTLVYTDPGRNIRYRLTPKTVTRSVLPMDQYEPKDDWPLLGIMRWAGSTVAKDMHTGAHGRLVYEHALSLQIRGYVRGDHPILTDAVLAGDLLEDLWADHFACLTVDPTLGGLVDDFGPVGELETDQGALEPDAYFIKPWLARASAELE